MSISIQWAIFASAIIFGVGGVIGLCCGISVRLLLRGRLRDSVMDFVMGGAACLAVAVVLSVFCPTTHKFAEPYPAAYVAAGIAPVLLQLAARMISRR